MRTWQRYWVRGLLAVAIGVAVFGLCAASPALWDTALLAGWDAGVITWLILTFAAIGRADARRTWKQSQALEPLTLVLLVVVIVTSIVGLLGAIALSARRSSGRGQVAQSIHFSAGAVAVVLAWLLVHTEFGLYYARLYYDESTPDAGSTAGSAAAPGAYRKGLEFPEGELVDYWAFMYYSFTIAMCYQTSDVTITEPWMRRMTLLHAIVSFAFVLIILSYSVNAVGNAI